jgi:hypothetical protein
MLVACRLTGLSALETYYAEAECARNSGRRRAPDGLPPHSAMRVAGWSPKGILGPSCGPGEGHGGRREAA